MSAATRYQVAAAILVSAALSLWKLWFTPLVNTDAILYMVAAETYLAEGLAASLSVYSWPFLHVAMAELHSLTGLSLATSGQLLMATCFALLVLAFLRVCGELGADARTRWFALAVILCHPIVNDFRPNLVRDPGMLAFVLLALAEQLRFTRTGRHRHALGWLAALGMAFLFRVEALALVALGPLAILFSSAWDRATRWRRCGTLYLAPLALAIVGAGLWLASGDREAGENLKLTNDLEFLTRNLANFSATTARVADIIAGQVLGEFSSHDAHLALYAIVATITIASLTRAITLPYLIPLLLARTAKGGIRWPRELIQVGWYGGVILCYLLAFALFTRFSTTRYGLQLALLLLVPLPFLLDHWWRQANGRRWVRSLIILALTVNGLDSLIGSDWKKTYIRDAAHWLRQSDALPAGDVITNEPYIGYFGEKTNTELVLRAINASREPLTERRDLYWLANYNYAHRVKRGRAEKQLVDDIDRGDGEILQVFPGADGRSVYIFTMKRDLPRSPLLLERPE